jgi:hypothetical protein
LEEDDGFRFLPTSQKPKPFRVARMPAERQDLIRFMYVVIRIGSVGSWKNAQEKEGSGKKLCVGYGREKEKRKSSYVRVMGKKKKGSG